MVDNIEIPTGAMGEDPEVLMVEDLPGTIDPKLAIEIGKRGGRVIQEHGKARSFLPIQRARALFAKIKPRTDVEGESI